MNLFIINTNKTTNPRYELEMIDEQKCAAYRSTKTAIEQIRKNDVVLLYSNKRGIITSGVADGIVHKKTDLGEENAEYFMKLQCFTEYVNDISYQKILSIIQQADPSFDRPFGLTLLKFEPPLSEEIWKGISRYV